MRILSVFIALAFFAAPAVAAKSNKWKLDILPPKSANPVACQVTLKPPFKAFLSILVYTDYQWTIKFAHPRWDTVKINKKNLRVFIDKRRISYSSFESSGNGVHYINMHTANSYRALQNGRKLKIKIGSEYIVWPLAGTHIALRKLLKCIRRVISSQSNKLSASNLIDPTNSPIGQSFSAEESMSMVRRLLKISNTNNYTLSPSPHSPGQPASVYFKHIDGSGGFFTLYRNVTDRDTADIRIDAMLFSSSTGCQGDYTSGKKSIPSTNGSLIRAAIARCQGNNWQRIHEYMVVLNRSGFLLQQTTIYTNNAGQIPKKPRSASDNPILDAILKSKNLK